jgi:hypothetical protein
MFLGVFKTSLSRLATVAIPPITILAKTAPSNILMQRQAGQARITRRPI